MARELARRVAERIAPDGTKAKQYGYGDRPLPEPVLREFRNGGSGERCDYAECLWNAGDERALSDVRGYRSRGRANIGARPGIEPSCRFSASPN
jgi:hypothetical protein